MMRFLHYLFLPSHIMLGAVSVRDRLLWLGLRTPAGRSWCGACSCGWCTCCTSPGLSTRPRTSGATATTRPRDDSRNLWWVGLLAFGEGWHNNHHAYQRMARQGHKWWEIDMTYWMILLMEKVGSGLERGQGSSQAHEAGLSKVFARELPSDNSRPMPLAGLSLDLSSSGNLELQAQSGWYTIFLKFCKPRNVGMVPVTLAVSVLRK